MPYRGTNSKRQVVHAKSKNTLRDGAKDHYRSEKKELEHELNVNRSTIEKLLNDGFKYSRSVEEGKTVIIHFINGDQEMRTVLFNYQDNLQTLRNLFIN